MTEDSSVIWGRRSTAAAGARTGVPRREVGLLVASLDDLLDATGGEFPDTLGVTCLFEVLLGTGDPENVAIILSTSKSLTGV